MRRPCSRPWGGALLLLLALCLFLCLGAPRRETVLLTEPPDPARTVSAFFDAYCAGDWDAAAALVSGAPSLGMEDGEQAGPVWDAFLQSLSWISAGDCVREGMTARQPVTLRCLDTLALTEGLDEDMQLLLSERVAQAPRKEDVYDSDNNYREELVLSVLEQALAARLETPEAYMTERRVTVQLRYEDLRWYLMPDETLWKALSGSGA